MLKKSGFENLLCNLVKKGMGENKSIGFYDINEIIVRPVKTLWCISQSRKDTLSKILHDNTRFWGGLYNAIVPIINGTLSEFWIDFVRKYDPDMIVIVSNEINQDFSEKMSEMLFLNIIDYKDLPTLKKKYDTQTFGLGTNISKIIDYKYEEGVTPIISEYPVTNEFYIYRIASVGHPKPYEDNNFFNVEEWETHNLCNYIYSMEFFSFKDQTDEIAWISNDLLRNISNLYEEDEKSNNQFSLDWLNQKSLSFEYVGDLEFDLFFKFKHIQVFGERIYVIIGSYANMETFALFWNLRMTLRKVLWVPEEFFIEVFPKLNLSDEQTIILISLEVEYNTLVNIASILDSDFPKHSVLAFDFYSSDLIPIIKPFSKEVGRVQIPLFITKNYTVIYNEKIDQFIQKAMQKSGRMNLIVEFIPTKLKIPSKRFLNSMIPKADRVTEDNGFCFFISDDIEMNLPYPFSFSFSVKFPDLLQVIQKWMEDAFSENFIGFELSDKGKYSKKAIELFGSLEECADSFDNEYKQGIINTFFKTKKQEEGNKKIAKSDHTYEGLKKNLVQSRGISFEEDKIKVIVEQFIEKKILLQGLKLVCKECNNTEWYPLSQVSEIFQCKRCLSANPVAFSPNIYLRLNESVLQAFTYFFQPTIKGLLFLKQKSQYSLEYFLETKIKFTENSIERKIELDFLGIYDGKLFIGEAKNSSAGFNKETFDKLIKYTQKLQPDMFFISVSNLIKGKRKYIDLLRNKMKDNRIEVEIAFSRKL